MPTLSVVIAVLGLSLDSDAVVIGAMLVAPLMTPLIGTAAALVMGWPRRLAQSGLAVLAGSGGAVGISTMAAKPGRHAAGTTVDRARVAVAAVPGAHAKVGGGTAIRQDVQQYATRDRT